MKRLLLLIEHQQNRKILAQSLAKDYLILSAQAQENFVLSSKQLLAEDFDLCFIDFGAVHQLRELVLAKRATTIPIFLPFVFLTTLQEVNLSCDHLEQLIDDIIYLPIRKIELQTKLRVLLRSRYSSLQLQKTQQQLQEALSQEKELNQLKTRFISTVSHEFRNPLNSIAGMAQILEAYGDRLSPEKKSEIFQQLKRNVTTMNNLLEDVLTISRQNMGKLKLNSKSIDLEPFCRSLIDEIQIVFNHKQSIQFTYQGEPKFNLDDKLLHHILTNLLSNACKYSPENTVIDFEIQVSDAELVLIISDRGIGIPPNDIPKLFDSFYRASNSQGFQGTGLGLAIAKEYIELHQGAIAVESELNVGTTFKVTIPSQPSSSIAKQNLAG